MTKELNEHSHRRLNILTGEWVQVSPHRSKRPWQGQVEKPVIEEGHKYDPDCYLCSGNVRVGGDKNPNYDSTFVFVNDFGALQELIPEKNYEDGVIQAKSEKGICKVVCFSPKHNLTLPELEVGEILNVVNVWVNEFEKLSELDFIQYVQIFENKGAVMGCSNPHPHGQIWAQQSIPVEVEKKQRNQRDFFENEGVGLLEKYLEQELELNERILFQNDHMVVLIPFWATWPFETMILPKRRMSQIPEMKDDEKLSLAEAIRWITIRYDNLFQTSFPYSSGIHQAPSDGFEHSEWHWHLSFYPPLLRSATIKKFMVGYELFANAQRDVTPEWAAIKLGEQSGVHYKRGNDSY